MASGTPRNESFASFHALRFVCCHWNDVVVVVVVVVVAFVLMELCVLVLVALSWLADHDMAVSFWLFVFDPLFLFLLSCGNLKKKTMICGLHTTTADSSSLLYSNGRATRAQDANKATKGTHETMRAQ
jgi:hypothetical protein